MSGAAARTTSAGRLVPARAQIASRMVDGRSPNPDRFSRTDAMPRGLYANINAKQARIEAGSGEKMKKPGSKGAPTAAAFKASAKTAKRK